MQILVGSHSNCRGHGLTTKWPVSYTHLDVYKRQVLNQRPLFFLRPDMVTKKKTLNASLSSRAPLSAAIGTAGKDHQFRATLIFRAMNCRMV